MKLFRKATNIILVFCSAYTASSIWFFNGDTWKYSMPIALIVIGLRFYVEESLKE